MSKKLAKILKTDVLENLPSLAKIVQSKGRRGDTVLAHISRREAEMLKRRGGSGTINPDTGLPEFFGEEDYFGGFGDTSAFTTSPAQTQTFEAPVGSAMTYDQPAGPTLSEATYGPDISQRALTGDIPGYTSGAGLNVGDYIVPGGAPSGQFNYGLFTQNATAGAPYSGETITSPAASPQAIADAIAAAGGGVGRGDAATSIDAPGVSTKAADTSEKGMFDDLLKGKNALGLGILGAGGLMGYLNQQKAAGQAKNAAAQIQAAYAAAAQQQKDLAAPLIGPGYTQLSQALQGSLSPANQQAMQAAQARVAQASARSGGVGAVQSAVQEEAFRQQLLSQQQQQALALLAPGNAMIQAAINAQLQGATQGLSTRLGLEQQANNAAMGLYSALGSAVGGGLMKSA